MWYIRTSGQHLPILSRNCLSECLRHEPCPACVQRGADRAGDNLAVYPDHKWCFSCGYWEGQKREFHSVEKQQPKQNANDLPFDFSPNIRRDALAWIKQYGITDEELKRNNVGWSQSKEQLIFPVILEGQLLMWQGRYFGANPEYPKYNTRGARDVYHILGTGEPITIVEDFVSCVKVSRQTSAMPLWGSEVSTRQARHLARYFDRMAIWLDPDKKKESLKFSNRCLLFFKEVRIISSDKDPKYYTDGEIREFIRGH